MSQSKETLSNEKLTKMRYYMQNYGFDAFLVFSADAHKSEYVADYEKRRAFLSGFTGSAGTAVVTQQKAALWTDGRYFNQASSELSSHWTLMKSGLPGVPELGPWISSTLSPGQVVGVDPTLISGKEALNLQKSLSSKNVQLIGLTPTKPNPVDIVWNEMADICPRPPPPVCPARVQPERYAGLSHHEKIRDIQQVIGQKGADFGVFGALDEIAWLLNLRGSDVTFNPVVKAYAIVFSSDSEIGGYDDEEENITKKRKIDSTTKAAQSVVLFIDDIKLSDEVQSHLSCGCADKGSGSEILVKPYCDVTSYIHHTLQQADNAKVLLDSNCLNWEIYATIVKGVKGVDIIDTPSVIASAKAIKNPVEIQGFRDCHVRDGVALTAFLSWLEKYMSFEVDSQPLSEFDAAMKLENFRAAMPLHVSPSFDTISSYGSNGAIIHYRPPAEGSRLLGKSSLYLLDSGGQYIDGTTDVTRTLYFGPCEFENDLESDETHRKKYEEMRDAFTYVLKAHVALATARFPEGTLGYRLDAITRAPLWSAGLDYAHGTGHGVGAYLNVHEGPQGIGIRPRYGDMGFKVGMTTSNEPGYYKDGDYGIRIENVCVTVDVDSSLFPFANAGKNFLGFETLTMCPLDRCLVNTSLLSAEEISWVDSYHAKVREALLAGMTEHFPEALPYLLRTTEPLQVYQTH